MLRRASIGTRLGRAALRLFAALIAALVPLCGAAAPPQVTCTVSALALAFGAYDTVNNLNGTTSITVSCDNINQGTGGVVPYTVALSSGSGSYAARQMLSGSNVLLYNLYTDPTHTTVWGDGTSGTRTVSGSFTNPPKSQSATLTVYGLIPGPQNVAAGTYTTTAPIVITVSY